MQTFLRDLRFALQNLFRGRHFGPLAILVLALGIGASTVMFSMIYALVLAPFDYKNANRMAVMTVQDRADPNNSVESFTIPEFLDYRQQNHVFDDMVGSYRLSVVLSGRGAAEDLVGSYTTTNAFAFFGVPPLLGRGFTEADGQPGATPVCVISYSLWRQQFGSDLKILGSALVLNGVARTVVGIMPPRFQGYGAQVWLPLGLYSDADGATEADGSPISVGIVGRLKSGVTRQMAAADLDVIARRLAKIYPDRYPRQFIVVTQTLINDVMGRFKTLLYELFAATGMLLLIACSNVGNLLLARATTRDKEFAIRASLGASRGRLVRQLLVESFALSLIACLVGCVFAFLGLRGVLAIFPVALHLDTAIRLNPAALLFAIGMAVLTTFLCGFVPALRAARGELRSRLTGTAYCAGLHHGRFRAALIIAEVALSIVLLVGASLMMRTFISVTRVNLGFNPKKILYAYLVIPKEMYQSARERNAYFRQVLNRVGGLPGVISAAETNTLPPLWEGEYSQVTISGKTTFQIPPASIDLCSGSFFRTMGLTVLRGATFSETDVNSAHEVAVVNETFARRYFANKNPIGEAIKLTVFDKVSDVPPDASFEIVGVVSDFRNESVKRPAIPEVFLPDTISRINDHVILARVAVTPSSLLKGFQAAIHSVDSRVAFRTSGSVESFVQDHAYAPYEFGFATYATFGALGLVLAITGVFGVMAYTVSLRTHEIGIRMALGAQPRDILRIVLIRGLRLIAEGAFLGVFLSFGLVRLMANVVWGVSPTDPWTFCGVATIIVACGLGACYIPARRAMRVDPMVALRHE